MSKRVRIGFFHISASAGVQLTNTVAIDGAARIGSTQLTRSPDRLMTLPKPPYNSTPPCREP
jgi:hypothetical protein